VPRFCLSARAARNGATAAATPSGTSNAPTARYARIEGQGKALLGRQRLGAADTLQHHLRVAAELMQYGRVDTRHSQTKVMGQLFRKRQCIVDSSQRRIRAPEQPLAPSANRSRANSGIMAVKLRMRPVPLKVVETAALLAVGLGRRRLASEEMGRPAGMVGFQLQPDIVVFLDQGQQSIRQAAGRI